LRIELNIREILYLSALAGAAEFMGIPDGFYGMDELEIQQEIMKIQSDLEKQGYAQTDFDGNFKPDTEVMKVIRVCALCEKYIFVDNISAGSNPVKLLFYFCGGEIIKVKEMSDKYELSPADPEDINHSILEHLNWVSQAEGTAGDRVIIPQNLLAQVKASTENEFSGEASLEELYKAGCSNTLAKIIYSGLSGASNYYSVIIVDFNSEENDVLSIMAVNSKNGSLELIPAAIDEEEAVEFRMINYGTFKNKLTDALTLIGISGSSGEFI